MDGRGRPPAGYFTSAWQTVAGLDARQARRGVLPGMVRTGATSPTRRRSTCATSARTATGRRRRSRTTARSSKSTCCRHSASSGSRTSQWSPSRPSRRTSGSVYTSRTADHPPHPQQGLERPVGDPLPRERKVWGLPLNPAAELERHPGRNSGDIEVFSPEEVHALLRAARDEPRCRGLRDRRVRRPAHGRASGARVARRRLPPVGDPCTCELRTGELSVPKSGKVRSVPMVDEVAQRLAVLSNRKWFTGDDDLVFCEEGGTWLNDDRLRRRTRD